MDHDLVMFVKGKLTVIGCAIESMVGVYVGGSQLDMELRNATYAINRASAALDTMEREPLKGDRGDGAPLSC